MCADLALAASPEQISGRYITERGEPGRYPAIVADPGVQDAVVAAARDLARHAVAGTPGRR